ncbi:HAD-IIIC family phosphatase [Methylocystis sp. WRRC1]|uniref:HAD-IIIC family phosphatase n=1 Tax=Methylocystis sp. WRRC1 TaxID=1732014 RepID=UPI001D14E7C5|nr:HAD-IIIC family phosphatase [Methylocystis sp. WRRC1]MCC3245014.1 HAD-IIIC family phosphatase [Methylocystis sp. WRRC1]
MWTGLGWLPSSPADFRDCVRGIRRDAAEGVDPESLWLRAKALGNCALDEVQLAQLARVVDDLPEGGNVARQLKLGLIGDGTLSLLGPAITASATRRDLRIRVIQGDYGRAVDDAVNPDSPLRRMGLDAVLVACDRRGLGLDRAAFSPEESQQIAEMALGVVRSICAGLQQFVKGAILVQTIVPPMEPLFGSFDRRYSGAPLTQVDAFNSGLAQLAAENGFVIVDVARLAGSIGLERWDDPQQWHATKLPFSADVIPPYAELVARTLGAVYGKSRKCLVLDLDNTLWGGVIGDDGVAGIRLGQGSAAGEAFLSIQKMALELRNRGVILAVSSKNEDAAARLPFREHSEMVLKEDHIAVFQANWLDKAANLKVIAETLNIGLDALVFLDDNPAERAQVRAELPMVAVPELPSYPALYPRALMAAGYFEAVAFGDEDRKRADDYQANAARASLQAVASDMEAYLRSLGMKCAIQRFNAEGCARIAQLINKSNQFNLTTRRYTELEVGRMAADPRKHTMQVRLADRFGDNGMISVVIADIGDEKWTIDTWLMSCRVLGRRVEEAVLRHLVAAARAAGAKTLVGRYIPSAKNQMVRDHYGKLGFSEIIGDEPGSTWVLKLDDYVAPHLPMDIDEDLGSISHIVAA